MTLTVKPKKIGGTVNAIPSKSHVHRLLICASLADKPTEIGLSGTSDDIESTINVLTGLGAGFNKTENALHVTPIKRNKTPTTAPVLDSGESGSTLRFILPVAASLGVRALFTGHGRLPERPLDPLINQMKDHGVKFSSDKLPFEMSGALYGGTFYLPGDISSQFASGLLLSLPLVGGGKIVLTTPLQSAGYVEMTIESMKAFSAIVEYSGNEYTVNPGVSYITPEKLNAEGDWSNAAFWLCAGALSSPVTVKGLNLSSTQGDKEILSILSNFGAGVEADRDSVTVTPSHLQGIEINAGHIPDLVPVLSVVAAAASGVTRFTGVKRLRLKESDRLKAIAEMLSALGAKVSAGEDTLEISGNKKLAGGTVSGYNDHRMVMSAFIASLISENPVTVNGVETVNKSYPAFFEDFRLLGGEA